jgi:1-acyl-sn-glycerol-3-phosphate acyltransferase
VSLNGPPRLSLYPRLIAGISRLFLGVLARVRVEGVEHVPTQGPLIIAANHLSMSDPPLIGGWLAPKLGRRPVFLAKASLFVWPLRSFLRSLGARPVKAGGSDFGAYRLAKGVLDEGGVIVILPEGTRSRDGVLATPRSGVSLLATRTGTAVLPVGISGADAWLGRGRWVPRIGTRITLRVGRPFTLSLPEGADRREALKAADEQLMRRIAGLLDERHRGDWRPWPDDGPA